MFRIDSDGATINNRFTEGDPQTAVPATVVSDEWANNVQEEIIKPIEEMGIVLDKLQEGQLFDALLEMFLRGGRKLPVTHVLANNTADAVVTGFPVLNKSNHLARISFYYIERKTDSSNVQEFGLLVQVYDSADDVWKTSATTLFDDSGAFFSVDNGPGTDAAVLEVTTNDLAGANYVGTLKMTQLFEIRA